MDRTCLATQSGGWFWSETQFTPGGKLFLYMKENQFSAIYCFCNPISMLAFFVLLRRTVHCINLAVEKHSTSFRAVKQIKRMAPIKWEVQIRLSFTTPFVPGEPGAVTPSAPASAARDRAAPRSASWSCSGRHWAAPSPAAAAASGPGTQLPGPRPDAADTADHGPQQRRGRYKGTEEREMGRLRERVGVKHIEGERERGKKGNRERQGREEGAGGREKWWKWKDNRERQEIQKERGGERVGIWLGH